MSFKQTNSEHMQNSGARDHFMHDFNLMFDCAWYSSKGLGLNLIVLYGTFKPLLWLSPWANTGAAPIIQYPI